MIFMGKVLEFIFFFKFDLTEADILHQLLLFACFMYACSIGNNFM